MDERRPTLESLESELFDRIEASLEGDCASGCFDEENLTEDMAALLQQAVEKRERVAAFIQQLNLDAEACGAEIVRLVRRRRARENAAQRLSDYVMRVMEQTGQKKLDAPLYTMTIIHGPKRVEITDEEALYQDGRFVRQKPAPDPEPDLVKLKDALQAGEEVGFARLTDGTPRLAIR